jgi:hypothetical protein
VAGRIKSMKNPMTPLGIKPVTFWLVAQYSLLGLVNVDDTYDIQQTDNKFVVCELRGFHSSVIEYSGLARCDAALVLDVSKEHVTFLFQGFSVHGPYPQMQHHITVNQNSELCCTFKDE